MHIGDAQGELQPRPFLIRNESKRAVEPAFSDAAGAYLTFIVHFTPAAKTSPQLFFIRNSLLLVPVSETPVIVRLTFPVFATIKACGMLIVFAVCVGKDSVEGVTVIGVKAVPVTLMVCGLVLAPSLTVTVPVLLPPTVGANVTEMVQFPPGITVVPQLFV